MEHTEINTIQLRKVLTNFSEELELSFIDKRSTNKTHKQNVLEELNDVIKELSDRERQLQASIGIAKMLLDNNEYLSEQLEQNRTKKKEYSAELKSVRYELDTLKDDLVSHSRKSENLNEALIQAEEQILKFSSENNRLKSEFRKKRLSISINETDKLEEIRESMNKEIFALKRSKQDSLQEIKALEDKVYELEEANSSHIQTNQNLHKNNRKTTEKLKQTQEELDNVKEKLNIAETNFNNTHNRYIKALKQIRGLEEEIEIAQNCTPRSPLKVVEESDRSLMDELEGMNLENSTIDSDQELKKRPRLFETVSSIDIPPCRENKDVCQEYFMLAVQSIKLNSPYADFLSAVPTEMLYKKAITLEIPFHKWHDWIKDELNSAYVHILYQKDLKLKGPEKLLVKK